MIKILMINVLLISGLLMQACGEGNEEKNFYSITVDAYPGNGGTVTVLDAETNLPISDIENVECGKMVIIKAEPADGYRFDEWEGDLSSNDPTLEFPMSRNITATANFRQIATGTPVQVYGDLTIKDGNLVDKNEDIVQLRGMSMFWSQWMGKYWNENVVNWLVDDWNISVIRASMGVDDSDGYIHKPAVERAKLEAVVDAAIDKGIYVIIDWHSHHAEDYQDEAVAFFTEIAGKYGANPNVIYEIYNEPLDISWANVLKPYSETVIESIREVDPDNLIVVGTPNWSQDLNVAVNDPIDGINIAYGFHFYASEPVHYNNLRNKLTSAKEAGLPVFVTEWGVSEASGTGDFNKDWTNDWLTLMDQYKLSWCNWSVADKSETSAALVPGVSINGNWDSSDLTESGNYVRTLLRSY